MSSHHGAGQSDGHDLYEAMAQRPEFARLRHQYRRFIIPATIAFLSWYALYVLMSMFASDFMNHVLFGNINVALVFGLLQFVTTFGIAYLYSRYSNTHLDPLSSQLTAEFDATVAERRNGSGTGTFEGGVR